MKLQIDSFYLDFTGGDVYLKYKKKYICNFTDDFLQYRY